MCSARASQSACWSISFTRRSGQKSSEHDPEEQRDMTFNGWLQIAIYAALVILITKPFGGYLTRVFSGERTSLSPVLHPVEVGIYKLCGTSEREEQHWLSYALAMLAFSFAGFVIIYAIQRLQNVLPFNPQG